MTVRFGSVCSGIEAASYAWHQIGWETAWVSEIKPFPCMVLSERYPDIENVGDMRYIELDLSMGFYEAPEVLVGGTPCQSFSVSGLRKGLEDERGNLTLEFIRIADEIDRRRAEEGQEPATTVWENVPGILSSKDNAFGCFLAGLAGEDEPLLPPGKRWSNVGCVYGPTRTVAWRILDAQYFGVPQRRRRVFVIASARDGVDPTQILFEFDGLRRDHAPQRKKGQTTTHSIAPSITGSGRGFARVGEPRGQDPVVAQAFRMVSFGEYTNDGTASAMKARDYKDATDLVVYPIHDKATRYKGKDGRGASNGLGIGREHDPCAVLTAGDRHAVAILQEDPLGLEDEPCFAFNWHNGGNQNTLGADTVTSALTTSHAPAVAIKNGQGLRYIVRRLTPTECARLQAFPDDWCRIPWRGKPAEECPDGHQYEAYGNSMCTYVMLWLGIRIDAALSADLGL